jgi:hypothetical protein
MVDDRNRLFSYVNEVLRELEVEVVPYEGAGGAIERASPLQPVLNEPPFDEITLNTGRVLQFERADVAHLLGTDDGTVLLGIQQGRGYIFISSASRPFTNVGLRDEASAALVLNLLRRVPPDGRILFDEYHHGFFEPPSLRSTVFSNAWGWALLYSLVVLVLYLLLTGRRFGRPVPLAEESARRSSAEYVESMADLFQRGRQRQYVLQHYYTAFKRRLAKPYGINPRLEDERFVAELASYSTIDREKLLALLHRMQRQHVSEDELLRVVNEADTDWTRK